jgi:hypothetical protein
LPGGLRLEAPADGGLYFLELLGGRLEGHARSIKKARHKCDGADTALVRASEKGL